MRISDWSSDVCSSDLAIRLGANVVGQAAGVLDAALLGPQAVIEHFQVLIEQLRIACFCTGSADLVALRRAPLQIGRASGRERVCKDVYISVVSVSLKKNTHLT